jgi:phosphotriesterase-related protein
MAMVNTVLGPVASEGLGLTLMHEHLAFGFPGWYGDVTAAPFDRAAALETCGRNIEALKALGVRTIVDPTPNDCGRDPEFQREVAERTGINVIGATGYYYETDGAAAYFKFRGRFGADVGAEIYDMFVREITEGIAGTGIKAGVIKLASSKGAITDYERLFFKAAARAQRETDVPIMTHTQDGTMGPEQAELLIAEGADPRRIVIGHMSDNVDIRYQVRTLAQGVNVAFDRMGMQGRVRDVERVACLVGLIGTGYANRIMLSHDVCINWLGRPMPFAANPSPALADWQVTNIFNKIIPALREGGVSEAQINTIFVDNPRRLFGGE